MKTIKLNKDQNDLLEGIILGVMFGAFSSYEGKQQVKNLVEPLGIKAETVEYSPTSKEICGEELDPTVGLLAKMLKDTNDAHHAYEAENPDHKESWQDWYAQHIVDNYDMSATLVSEDEENTFM